MAASIPVTTFGDPEWALAEALANVLAGQDLPVEPIAGVLPAELSEVTVHVESLGGQVVNPGLLLAAVKIDCRAPLESEVLTVASMVDAALRVLDAEQIDGDALIVGVSPTNYFYANPDPRNPKFYRTSQSARLTVKAI